MSAVIASSQTSTVASARRHPEHASAQRDRMLFARSQAGDRCARDELVERWLPLARSIARRYERRGESSADLVQVASLALVKAVDGYDPTLGNAFTSYAVPSIVGELKRHFRDRGWAVRPPRALQELTLRVEGATTRLAGQLDRAPTVAEIAAAIDSTDEEVLEALQARAARDALSLQAPRGAPEAITLEDTLGAGEDGFAQIEARAYLDQLMTGLPRQEREMLHLRFEQDMTQAEIAAVFSISQMHVSRTLRRAIDQLREVAEQHERMLAARLQAQTPALGPAIGRAVP